MVRPAVEDEQALFGAGPDERLARIRVRVASGAVLDEFDADHQAAAPDVADAIVLCHQRPETVLEFLAAPGGIGHEALLGDGAHHGHAGRAAHRVAAEGGAVGANTPALLQFAARDDCPDRQTVGEGLGHANDVRHDAGVLEGPHPAGPSDAGLDLVADEQDAVLIA